jgi:hypothetical protein
LLDDDDEELLLPQAANKAADAKTVALKLKVLLSFIVLFSFIFLDTRVLSEIKKVGQPINL